MDDDGDSKPIRNAMVMRFLSPSYDEFSIELTNFSDATNGQKYFDQMTITDLKYKVRLIVQLRFGYI
jgi:predicted Zn-dependent protease